VVKKYAFLDTNTFLHYRSFDEIDWPKVLGCDEVGLLIAPVTLSELDRKKYEASGKIRDRARAVVTRLGAFVEKPLPATVRDGVDIRFLEVEPTGDVTVLGLDRQNQDDRLLASVIDFRNQHPGDEVVIVTADIGLRVKARSRNVEVVSLPDDCKLPDEPDPLEKRNQQLEREILELKRVMPRLELTFRGGSDRIIATLSEPRPLDREELARKRKQVRLGHRKMEGPGGQKQDVSAENFSEIARLALTPLLPLAQEQIDSYNEAMDLFYDEYDQWIIEQQEFEALIARSIKLELTISNSGTAPAEDIDVSLTFPDGFHLLGEKEYPTPPVQPTPPKPELFSPFVPKQLFDFGKLFSGNRFRLPEGFGHLHRPNVSEASIRKTNSYAVNYQIGMIKHESSEQLSPLFVVFPERETATSFNFGFRVHSRNMPKSAVGQLHVIVKTTERAPRSPGTPH
jgi:hypothetical protein